MRRKPMPLYHEAKSGYWRIPQCLPSWLKFAGTMRSDEVEQRTNSLGNLNPARSLDQI